MTDADALLRRLKEKYGANRVLSDPEDIYVYSRVGEFGVKEAQPPIAVLRLKPTEAETLVDIVGDDAQIIIGYSGENKPGAPVLLVDTGEPITLQELEESVSEQAKARDGKRDQTKSLSQLPLQAAAYLQSREGYRLRERMSGGAGFCVVQRFLGGHETYSSKGRLLLSRALSRGELEASPRLVDVMYSCTACGQCYDQHSSGVLEINNAIIKTRNTIAEQGKAPKLCGRLMDNLEAEGNPMGLPSEDRALWYDETADERTYGGNDVLYWPGCITSYRLPELVDANAAVLDAAGVDYGLLGKEEGCCGIILYLLGFWEEARRNAAEVSRVWEERSVRTVVTSCAGCYYAFTRVYPHLGVTLGVKVLHTSQFYDLLVRQGRLTLGERRGGVVWHDPCDLGRHCGVYEPPRRVLRAVPGLSLVEPGLSREHAVCCGAGGGLWTYNEGVAGDVGRQKVLEAIPGDVDGVVTGCPTCLLSLRNSARDARPGLKVYDLGEFLRETLM
ncbi:(Fe-S)-binding protein [Candidatus Bathyarchaeota archaeon]|nr:(Fe-S)-binding protein [Candidatus Bathyarchaeota archaeon]